MQRVHDDLADVADLEGREGDFFYWGKLRFQVFKGFHERVRGIHLVVAVGTDEQQVSRLLIGHEQLEQFERRDVRPLHVVNKKYERMLRLGEGADKLQKCAVESVLRFGWRQLGGHWLFADDEFQIGQHFDDDRRVGAHRVQKFFFPYRNGGVAFRKQLANQAAECLNARAIRCVAVELVIFSTNKITAPRHHRFVDFLDEFCFANARKARHGEQHRVALRGFVESSEQKLRLPLTPVQFLGNQKTVGHIFFPQRKNLDTARFLPLPGAFFQIGFQSLQTLIARFGRFFEQFQHDFRQNGWHSGAALCRRNGHPRKVCMHEYCSVARWERRRPGEQFVESGAERIKVGAVVNRAVHAPGLFGRDVVQRAFQIAVADNADGFVGQQSSDAEVYQPDILPLCVHQNIVGLDVFVDDVAVVQLGQHIGEPDSYREKHVERQGLFACDLAQSHAAKILHHQSRATGEFVQFEHFDRAFKIELLGDVIFPAQFCHFPGVGKLARADFQNHDLPVSLPHSAADGAAFVRQEGFFYIKIWDNYH